MSKKSTSVLFGTGAGAALRLLSSPVTSSSRAREPVKPTTGKVVGYFPSIKNNRAVAWESQLEQKACYIFEFSPEVISFREQPLTINYPLKGEIHRYTPDFELRLMDERLLYVEVKPASKLSDASLKEKLQAIHKYWREHNMEFIVLTEEHFGNSILQSNLRLLRSYLRTACDATLVRSSTYWIAKQFEPKLQDLFTFMGSQTKAYTLLAHQIIHTDLLFEIGPSSPVWIEVKQS